MMYNLRCSVKFFADTMTDKFTHHFQFEFVGNFFDYSANCFVWYARCTQLNGLIAAHLGYFHQLFGLFVHFTNGECTAAITVK